MWVEFVIQLFLFFSLKTILGQGCRKWKAGAARFDGDASVDAVQKLDQSAPLPVPLPRCICVDRNPDPDPASFPFVLASGCSGVLSREVESLAWLGPHVLLLLLLLRSLGRLPLPITGIIARNVSRLLAFGAAAAAITNRCRLGSSESFAACPRQSWPRV